MERIKTEVRTLECELDEEEIAARKDLILENLRRLDRKKAELVSSADELKAEIKALNHAISKDRRAVEEEKEFRSVACDVLKSIPEKKLRVVRTDTGDTIEERELRPDELPPPPPKQPELPFPSKSAGASGGEREACEDNPASSAELDEMIVRLDARRKELARLGDTATEAERSELAALEGELKAAEEEKARARLRESAEIIANRIAKLEGQRKAELDEIHRAADPRADLPQAERDRLIDAAEAKIKDLDGRIAELGSELAKLAADGFPKGDNPLLPAEYVARVKAGADSAPAAPIPCGSFRFPLPAYRDELMLELEGQPIGDPAALRLAVKAILAFLVKKEGSAVALASKVEMSDRSIRRFASGERLPDAQTVRKILAHFNREYFEGFELPGELRRWITPPAAPAAPAEPAAEPTPEPSASAA